MLNMELPSKVKGGFGVREDGEMEADDPLWRSLIGASRRRRKRLNVL